MSMCTPWNTTSRQKAKASPARRTRSWSPGSAGSRAPIGASERATSISDRTPCARSSRGFATRARRTPRHPSISGSRTGTDGRRRRTTQISPAHPRRAAPAPPRGQRGAPAAGAVRLDERLGRRRPVRSAARRRRERRPWRLDVRPASAARRLRP